MYATTVEQDLSQNFRGYKGPKSIFGQVRWGTTSGILGVVGGVWVSTVKMPKYPARPDMFHGLKYLPPPPGVVGMPRRFAIEVHSNS